MKLRKGISAALTAILIPSIVLSACSADKSGTAATQQGAAKSAETDKPVEIKWAGIFPPDTDDSYAQRFLEKKFNIKLVNVRLDASTAEQQLNVKLASGEIPDVIPGVTDINGFKNLVEQEIAAELPVDEIRKHMPNYAKYIDQLDASFWKAGFVGGKNYGIPRTYGEGNSYFLPAYNAAWLKKIGYNAPPDTLAELEDVLTKFRNEDPDGNGKKDTYGFSARGKDTLGSNQIFNIVFGAYGINPAAWSITDGKLQFGITMEGAREAFRTLNKWYKAELLDPEFITDDSSRYESKFINGQTGMLDQALWYQFDPSGSIGVNAGKSGMTFVVGQPLLGPGGKRYGSAHGMLQVPTIISAEAYKDEKKRVKIYELLDALAMDPETYLAAVHGEKGVHYDEVEGAAVPKPEYTDLQKAGAVAGIGYFYGLFKSNTLIHLSRPKSQMDYRAALNKDDVVRLINPLGQAILPGWTANKDAITKIIKEYEIKFVTGSIDVDKGFDDFVALLNKSGLKAATEEANEVYAELSK